MKLDSIRNIGIGLITVFVIAVLGIFLLSNSGFFPIIDPGISDDQYTLMNVQKFKNTPYNAIKPINISESQINQCMVLKTSLQEVIKSNQASLQFKLNNSDFNHIYSFLKSLSINGEVNFVYYQGFYFELSFIKT